MLIDQGLSGNSNPIGPAGLPGLMASAAARYPRPASWSELPQRREDRPIQQAVEVSPASAAVRRGEDWPEVGIETIETTSQDRIRFHFRADRHLLVACEQGRRSDSQADLEGLPSSALRDVSRQLTFVPAGHDYAEWFRPRTSNRFLLIYLDARPGDTLLERPRLFFQSEPLWSTILKLNGALGNNRPDLAEYVRAMATVLSCELRSLDLEEERARAAALGGLAAWQLRIVTEHIARNLAEPVRLTDLAALARLSPCHFSRAFKQSAGVAPHRYQTARRMDHARELLASQTMSVTDVGFAVGFSDTSSFSAAFRKANGMSPTAFMRALPTPPSGGARNPVSAGDLC